MYPSTLTDEYLTSKMGKHKLVSNLRNIVSTQKHQNVPLKTIASNGGSEQPSFDIYGLGMKKQESIGEKSIQKWNEFKEE